MIHAVFIFNTQGVARLTKFYKQPANSSIKTQLPDRIFKLIASRPGSLCNFLDAPRLSLPANSTAYTQSAYGSELSGEKARPPQDVWSADDTRIVYRNYATLYFVFVVDGSESELGVLDLIHVLVESLDRAFENVCELDLVFHFDEVHHILAEIIQGGLVLETNVQEISSAVLEARKARRESYAAANPLSIGGSTAGTSQRATNAMSTPLGWIAGKMTGLGSR
ncbi:putative APS3-AP-3 complex subunit [Clavulina sp. PMI_390]|nr:putative APS3-AP-3 complex subunit [Clavulina sp. PMI_390]